MVGPAELGGPQHPLVAGALMAEVVDGVADFLSRHDPGVLLMQQDRDEPGLPVVAVNDIGTLTIPGPHSARRLRRVVAYAIHRISSVMHRSLVRRAHLGTEWLTSWHRSRRSRRA